MHEVITSLPSSQSSNNQNNEITKTITQRIWIGGLNPPNLTSEMVQQRIKASFETKFDYLSFDDTLPGIITTINNNNHSSNSNSNNDKSKKYVTTWGEDAKTFFFLTAKNTIQTSKDKDGDSNMTPFEMISKQYNNVKWKGCQIQVELAKLHFLQRLEIERKETALEKQRMLSLSATIKHCHNMNPIPQSSSSSSSSSLLSSSVVAPQQIPELIKTKTNNIKRIRTLRIKKQHGEEAYMVDTKPIQTKNWKELNLTIQKQRNKYQKHEEKIIELRRESKKKSWQKQRHNNGSSDETIMNKKKKGDGNMSLQSKVFLNRGIRLIFKNDSDDDDYHHEMKSYKNSEIVSPKEVDNKTMVSSDSSFDSDNDSVDEIVHDSSETGSIQSDAKTNVEQPFSQKSKYQWSDSEDDDDDDDSDEDSEHNDKYNTHRYLTNSNHNALDEFESAVEHHQSEVHDFHVVDSANLVGEDKDERLFISLEDDVISNLNVLANLFPNIKVRARKENTELETKQTSSKNSTTSLMQRYDPNANTATDFELEQECNNDDNGMEGSKNELDIITHHSNHSMEGFSQNDDKTSTGTSDTDDESNYSKSNELATSNKNEEEEVVVVVGDEPESANEKQNQDTFHQIGRNNNDQIYEQKKLEDIFQQKRNGGGTTEFTMSSLFNFDINQSVEDPNVKDEKHHENKGFSFSFDVPKGQILDENETAAVDKIHNLKPKAETEKWNGESEISVKVGEDIEMNNLKYRRNLFFNESDLQQFEKKFFTLNEGIDEILLIMDDAKKREEDNKKWEEERKTLTLDWKRKQKYAQSKMKKKLKFR